MTWHDLTCCITSMLIKAPAADGATHQLLPLEPLESNHSFELRCHYSDGKKNILWWQVKLS